MQARLQARHGERRRKTIGARLRPPDSLDQFIERPRATSLRRFTEAMNMSMSSHAIERTLRAAWRGYVAEIAAWVPREWRAAVLWVAYVPDLPAVDAWRKGECARLDAARPGLGGTCIDAVEKDCAQRHSHGCRRRVRQAGSAGTTHWRLLWPQRQKAESRLLIELTGTVGAHVEQLAQAGPQESSGRYRRELAQSGNAPVPPARRHASRRVLPSRACGA